jgi:hypothetical protein
MANGVYYNGSTSTIEITGSLNASTFGITGSLLGTATGNVTGSGVNNQVAFFNSNNQISGSDGLYWDGVNNRLGIGTTTPTRRLSVFGQMDVTNTLFIGTGVGTSDASLDVGTGRTGIGAAYVDLVGDLTYTDYGSRFGRLGTGANAITNIRHRGTGDLSLITEDAAAIRFATTNLTRVSITSAGRMGIGTTTPSNDLTLANDSAAKPSTNTWTISSDARLKQNINPYTKGLSDLLQIDPVTYEYNGSASFSTGSTNIGVIAQDVMGTFPECISTYQAKLQETDEQETELYTFNSHALTYVMINSIKELKQQIDTLQAQIETLQNQINNP